MPDIVLNPAEEAAEKALKQMFACIDMGKSFRLEAGAGAGKTYSLIKAIIYLIEKRGSDLLRKHQRVACISYTNVASDEIASRIDRHPSIHSSTIHSFCWAIIKDFQSHLRKEIPNIESWSERLKEFGKEIGKQKIDYSEFGYRSIDESHVSLGHKDVLVLFVKLMEHSKFRALLVTRFPIIFIDEYQDTDQLIVPALKTYFLDTGIGPLIGFFGDHWQKIYGTGCGKIEHSALDVIGKESNFRSAPVIVKMLNRMRPKLPQHPKDQNAEGTVAVYHTNDWVGARLTGQHWADDLPAKVASAYLAALKVRLESEGWDFLPENTKILMLTHKVLATEQGYKNLADVFPYNESFIKKEDSNIAFFVDTLEPVCIAYSNKRFGEMFAALGGHTPAIHSYSDKESWVKDMDKLLELRSTDTIGAVLDYLKHTNRPRLTESVQRRGQELEQLWQAPNDDEPSSITRLRELRKVPYREVIALSNFINGYTPFETKHGVKGAEFENVLVVVGRGWNQYNFNQLLEWAGDLRSIPANKMDTFERNRNLFYVTCSRPKKRLALLFTQKLTNKALATLTSWFGNEAIHSLLV
ncbi:MAG: UvrD-helicase domain-containing protein [bacterium]